MSGSTHRLAVDTPYEDLGSATNAGIVQLFNFHNVASDRGLNQNTAGTPGHRRRTRRQREWWVRLSGLGGRHRLDPGGATRFGRALSGYDDLG